MTVMTLKLLDCLPIGVFVINPDCSIVMMNRIARKRVKSSCLSIVGGRLMLDDSQRHQQFSGLINVHAASVSPGGAASPFQLSTMEKVWITTVNVSSSKRRIIVYIEDVVPEIASPPQGMRQQYGLTEAEYRVIGALAGDCHSVNAVAESFNLSKHTVRTQMKVIYNKTGATSQIELIKMFWRVTK